MQNGRANESGEHNENGDILNDNLTVVAISSQLMEGQHDQRELQHESQNYVHSNIQPFLLFNFETSFLESYGFSLFFVLF